MTDSFIKAAQAIGASPILAQGGGGNLSEKEGKIMRVKASGYPLKDIAAGRGYVGCRFSPIAEYLERVHFTPRSEKLEREFNSLIESNIIPGERFGVPSIETGMHAILDPAAIHTHSVYANVLGCMNGGEKMLAELFPESISIPYANPGLALAHALFIEKKKAKLPQIIFLLNHGLITQADTMDEALRLTLKTNSKLRDYLEEKHATPFLVEETPYDFKAHLFPDSVVYSSLDFRGLPDHKKRVLHEIGSASNYILQTITKLGGKPNFFAARDVDFIANMDREKHRMKMVREM